LSTTFPCDASALSNEREHDKQRRSPHESVRKNPNPTAGPSRQKARAVVIRGQQGNHFTGNVKVSDAVTPTCAFAVSHTEREGERENRDATIDSDRQTSPRPQVAGMMLNLARWCDGSRWQRHRVGSRSLRAPPARTRKDAAIASGIEHDCSHLRQLTAKGYHRIQTSATPRAVSSAPSWTSAPRWSRPPMEKGWTLSAPSSSTLPARRRSRRPGRAGLGTGRDTVETA